MKTLYVLLLVITVLTGLKTLNKNESQGEYGKKNVDLIFKDMSKIDSL